MVSQRTRGQGFYLPGIWRHDARGSPVIWDFIDYGTNILKNTRSNVVQNFYYSSTQPSADRALRVNNSGGQVYAQGNYSLNGTDVDSQGNQEHPFLAVPVHTTDACTAARRVVARAGARPLDAIDQQYLSTITLPLSPCKG
jgi:hypothetical protein